MNEKPSRKREGESDYRAFFILGICIFVLGMSLVAAISLAFVSFLGLGAVFMIIALANRDKWAKPKKEN